MLNTTTRYPVFIVSKGRYDTPYTAQMFERDNVDYKILVEPQEYDLYAQKIDKKKIVRLPFSNLGLGSTPARNYAWQLAKEMKAERHWVFDDNIYHARRFVKGKKYKVNAGVAIIVAEDFTDRYSNVAISGFNYRYFVVSGDLKKPFYINVHVYSCMLIKTFSPYKWRLKYNEDVDLCLQVLNDKQCTILFNAFCMDKISTTRMLKGGNQTELYQNNSIKKKMLKTSSLQKMWPQYVESVIRYNRPHHKVDWRKHFTHSLIRRKDIDLSRLNKVDNYNLKLVKI